MLKAARQIRNLGKLNHFQPLYFSSQTIKKSEVYTRTGDKGRSSLYNGERRSKSDPIFNALGMTDELNSSIGLALAFYEKLKNSDPIIAKRLKIIQSRLFDVGASIATPINKKGTAETIKKVEFSDENIKKLELWIDELDSKLPTMNSFVLPSGGKTCSFFHMSRTICRRAERSVVGLIENEQTDPVVGKFLNRLSDYLYVISRHSAILNDKLETPWIPKEVFE